MLTWWFDGGDDEKKSAGGAPLLSPRLILKWALKWKNRKNGAGYMVRIEKNKKDSSFLKK